MSQPETPVPNDWLLEYDKEGEIDTPLDSTPENIKRCLGWFDGATTFFCGISLGLADTGLWCFGEPDKR